jgi:hypothetical protein
VSVRARGIHEVLDRDIIAAKDVKADFLKGRNVHSEIFVTLAAPLSVEISTGEARGDTWQLCDNTRLELAVVKI